MDAFRDNIKSDSGVRDAGPKNGVERQRSGLALCRKAAMSDECPNESRRHEAKRADYAEPLFGAKPPQLVQEEARAYDREQNNERLDRIESQFCMASPLDYMVSRG